MNFHGLDVKTILYSDLEAAPRFLHFDVLRLYHCHYKGSWGIPISDECQCFVNHLKPLENALNNTNLIHFIGSVSEDDSSCFRNHSNLLAYLQNQLLPICGRSRGYKFQIILLSDNKATTGAKIIENILRMPQIVNCSTVKFIFGYPNQRLLRLKGFLHQPTLLPVEAISNWLNRRSDESAPMGNNVQNQRARTLEIASVEIQNAPEMCDHLKKVPILLLMN